MLRHVILVAGLLFGSGMCALIYQMVWLREFRFVFGASTLASAAVLSVFLGGLGAGGLIDYLLLRRKPARKWTHLTVAAALYAVLPSVTVLVLFQSPLSQHLTNLWKPRYEKCWLGQSK